MLVHNDVQTASPSSRRAWIEIFCPGLEHPGAGSVALLAEGVDRNLLADCLCFGFVVSPSSRRAWIEIHSPARLYSPPSVALLAEGVDRNSMQIRGTSAHQKVALLAEGVDRNLFPFRLFAVTAKVALLAEGVDRNLIRHMGLMSVLVALLAEGVDRNFFSSSLTASVLYRSPSSRRAWIEIEVDEGDAGQRKVALLAEGVDRNQKIPQLALVVEGVALLAEGVDRNFCAKAARGRSRVALLAEGVDRNTPEKVRPSVPKWSPSSRRAWIEIVNYGRFCVTGMVALLAEGVDRNRLDAVQELDEAGRPPRGGRG